MLERLRELHAEARRDVAEANAAYREARELAEAGRVSRTWVCCAAWENDVRVELSAALALAVKAAERATIG